MYWFTISLLAIAFGVIQALIGGAKLVYSLPAYALFGVAALSTAVFAWRNRTHRPNALCIGAALALAGYVCGRALCSPVTYLARNDLFMVLGALAVYLVTAVHLAGSKERLTLLWILLGYALAHVLVGLVQFQAGNDYMLLPWIFRPDYGRRASGFYICPNHIAGLFEMLAMLAAAVCCWGRGRQWVRLTAGYAAAVCLVGLAITGSRGGYLSIIVGTVAFVALSLWAIKKLRHRQFLLFAWISTLSVALVLGTGLFLINKSRHLAARVDQVYDPTNMRIYLWQAALKEFALQPAFGAGSGTYDFYGRHFRSDQVQNDPVHVHDDYLELLAEYGVAGSVLMAVFLGVHFTSGIGGLKTIIRRKLKPKKKYQSNELALVIGAEAALAALLAHSVTDFNLHIPANTLFVAFLFGILANPTQSSAKQPATEGAEGASTSASPAWLRFFPALAGLLLVCASVPLIPAEYYGERARVALRDKEYPEAVAFAEQSLAEDKQNPDVYYSLGESRHFMGLMAASAPEKIALFQNAAAAFRGGLQFFPEDLRLQLKLGRTLDLLGQFDEAEEILRKALKFDPNFGNVYAFYGLHLHLQHHFKKAERFYRKALSLKENEISPQGLKDLEHDRKTAAANDIFSSFVTNRDDDDDDGDDEALMAAPAVENR